MGATPAGGGDFQRNVDIQEDTLRGGRNLEVNKHVLHIHMRYMWW